MRHRRAALGSKGLMSPRVQRRIAGIRGHPDTEVHSPRPAPTASVADASSPIRYRMRYHPPESAEGCFRSVSGTEGASLLTAGSTIHPLSSIQEIRP